MTALADQDFRRPYREEYVRVPADDVEAHIANGFEIICDDEDRSGAVLMRPPVRSACNRSAACG